MVSPVLRIFLNLWQIILDEIKRRLVQFLNLLQSWRLLLLHSVDAEFKNLEQRIFINFEWLIESSRVSDLVGSFNVHSCGSSLHFYVSREPISSSSESIGGCAHHNHSSILNWSSEPLSKLIERRLWCKRRGQRGGRHRSSRSWCESWLRHSIRLFHFHWKRKWLHGGGPNGWRSSAHILSDWSHWHWSSCSSLWERHAIQRLHCNTRWLGYGGSWSDESELWLNLVCLVNHI